jgi:histidinol-phosphate aminotransferase
LSTPAVNAVLAATLPGGHEAMVSRVREVLRERERVAVGLRVQGAQVFESAANFVFARFARSAEVMAACRRRGIIVRDRSLELEGCIRVTIGTPAENDAFLRAVTEVEG